MFTCPRCNTQLANGSRFCNSCGMQFDQPVATPGQSVPLGQIPPGQSPPGQQNLGGQFQAMPPPKKKRNPFAIGCLGVLGFFIIVGVIGNLAGGGKGPGSVPSSSSSGNSAAQSSDGNNAASVPNHSTPSSSSESSSNASSTTPSEPAAINVSASELVSDYNANEVSADDKYKGKVLAISGTVDSIGKDIMDTPYVTLHVDNDLLGVQCMFDNQYKAALSKLHKGQRIRLHGTCKGKTLNIILADCTPSRPTR